MKRILAVAGALVLVSLGLACRKPSVGSPPATPAAPAGISDGGYNTSYEFTAFTTDPDSDSVAIRFSWGDGATSDWSAWVASGETVAQAHSWPSAGYYEVKAQAKDNTNSTSNWSAPLAVTITTNRAPGTPAIPTGPATAPKDSWYLFTSITTDPDGDGVSYRFSWGNGDTSEWGGWTQSGTTGAAGYRYPSVGTFQVRAQARDANEARSGWSDSLRVRIVWSFAPEAPIRPTGLTHFDIGLPYTWSTKATHPQNDSVRIQFSWGDGNIDSFGHMVANNAFFDTTHTYHLPGSYKIAARARDAAGLESPWSETLVVTADTSSIVPRGAPHALVLSAATDSTVNIVWAVDSTPSRYVVLFKETGTSNYDSVGGTQSLSFVHDPIHRTGQYKVAAVYDSGQVASAEAPSTAPIANSLRWIPELSVVGRNTGYGWDRTTGEAFLYDMTALDSFDKVDFYVTDFATGFAGPSYYAASPDTAPLDPGGIVPPGYWHLTMFSHLDSTATENSMLPRFITSRYRRSSLLDSLPRLVACSTEDSCYALLYVDYVNTVTGEARIETWFQKIKGLRLIEHTY